MNIAYIHANNCEDAKNDKMPSRKFSSLELESSACSDQYRQLYNKRGNVSSSSAERHSHGILSKWGMESRQHFASAAFARCTSMKNDGVCAAYSETVIWSRRTLFVGSTIIKPPQHRL